MLPLDCVKSGQAGKTPVTSAISCLLLASSFPSSAGRSSPPPPLAAGWEMEHASFQPWLQRAVPGPGSMAPAPAETPRDRSLMPRQLNLAQRFSCEKLEPTHSGLADPHSRMGWALESPGPWRGGATGAQGANCLTYEESFLQQETCTIPPRIRFFLFIA